ncbi:MAG: universal stress protein [Bacteroidota bacterium]
MSFRHILVPTDFSPPATQAARYAAGLAKALGARLELLHVCQETGMHYHLSWSPTGLQVDEMSDEEGARPRLERLATRFTARGVPTQATVTKPMGVIRGILDASQRTDLVVLASSTWPEASPEPGSISLSVAHRAACPVLLVDADLHADASALTPGVRLLVPTDLSEASATALRLARELAASLDGTVEVVHALSAGSESAVWGGEAVEADDELPEARRLRYVQRFVDAAGGAPVPLEIRLVEGPTHEAIARAAQEDDPDLVVIGRPTDRPEAPDRLLAAMRSAMTCPALRASLP